MSRAKNKYGHKRQHWVAASYLRPWCDPNASGLNPFVWRVSRDGQTIKPKSPEKTFFENELYTVRRRDGTRDLTLEGLYQRLENEFVIARNRLTAPDGEISAGDFVSITTFMAAQLVRTPAFREHWAGQLGQVVAAGEELEQRMAGATQPEGQQASRTLRGSGPSFTLEQMRAARDNPLTLVSPPALLGLVEIFGSMNLLLLTTDDPVGFITSDAPCCVYDPEAHKGPPIFRRTVALGSPTVEVSMAITPSTTAMLTHHRRLNGYAVVEPNLVDNLNQRTRDYCHKEFVVNSKVISPAWFNSDKHLHADDEIAD